MFLDFNDMHEIYNEITIFYLFRTGKEIERNVEEKKKKRKKWAREHREKRLKQKMSLFKKDKTSAKQVKKPVKKIHNE